MGVTIDAVVAQVVRRFGRLRAPCADWDDLQQEGYRVALASLDKWRPEHGPLANYLYVAVLRSLGNYLSANLAAVSIAGRWELGREYQVRVPVDTFDEASTDTPEDTLLSREQEHLLTRWRINFYRVVDRELEALTDDQAEIVRGLYGLDGREEESVHDLMERLGCTQRQVYAARERFKRRISECLELYVLDRQREELR